MPKKILLTPPPPGFKINRPRPGAPGACPKCSNLGILVIGGGKHCNNCGHEWDNKVKVSRGPTRAEMNNGWKAPDIKKLARRGH